MELEKIRKILNDNAFIHTSGTAEETKVAEYLKGCCEELGVKAYLEPFDVAMTTVKAASLKADGQEYPCKGYKLCGSGTVKAPLYYMPNTDKMSIAGAKDKIVMLDTGVTHFLYQDLLEAGAKGFITYDGCVNLQDDDIDFKELRPYVSLGKKILGVNVNAKTAAKIVASAPEEIEISVEQDEYDGISHNVIADIPGTSDETIVLTAHYDTTPLSVGSYDNLTGCIGLLGIMEEMMDQPIHYSLRFVFCGSEERGLLGSKAYVKAHQDELNKVVLNINLDMIGTIMGKFIACVSAEDKLVHYIQYMASEMGWGIAARAGVYSSDSTPFADQGVPAVSFARLTNPAQGTIHNRYDTAALLSDRQISLDTGFIAEFTSRMACAYRCPVGRDIPERIKTELDEYLNRKRKQD